ncbi:SGTA1 [Auxenochlorella protothecoides x Auxenochlorella symbiontica]
MAPSTIVDAEAAVKSKKYDEALRIYDELIEGSHSKDPILLADRANVQYRLKNIEKALGDAASALELDPRQVLALHVKGQALFAEGDFCAALQAFEQLMVLEPAKRVYKQWVGMCRVRLGEKIAPTEDSEAFSLGKAPQAVQSHPVSSPSKPKAATIDDAEYGKYWRTSATPGGNGGGGGAGLSEPQPTYRHQWFQTAEKVEVGVLAKGLKAEQVEVDIAERRLRVQIRDVSGKQDYDLDVRLAGQVAASQSSWSVLGSKVEVVLAKADDQQWPDLAERPVAGGGPGVDEMGTIADASLAAQEGAAPVYPYAGKKVDWDAVEAAVKAEEKQEQPEGDAGVMKFFQELYQNGDEDFQRAMMKSYVESGGIELSTNWKEVAKKDFKASRAKR